MCPATCVQRLRNTCWQCTNCDGDQPVNFSGCSRYQHLYHNQRTASQQREMRTPRTHTALFSKPTGPFPNAKSPSFFTQSTTHMGPHSSSFYVLPEPSPSQFRPWIHKIYRHHVQLRQIVSSGALVSTTTPRDERHINKIRRGNWYGFLVSFSFPIIRNLLIMALNTNSISHKNAELELFLNANKIDSILKTNSPCQVFSDTDSTETSLVGE